MLGQRSSLFLPSLARLSLMAMLAASLVVSPRFAAAQDEDAGFAMPGPDMEIPVEPPLIKAKVITEIAEAVGLDQAQVELVRALHQGYVSTFTAAATEFRDHMQALIKQVESPSDWMTIGMEVQESQREWLKRRTQIGQDFFESVKSTLNEKQIGVWERFQRDRRRHTTLHIGAFFAGEGVDVVALVNDLDIEPQQRAAIDPTLDAYAGEIDGLLDQRDRAIDDVRTIDFAHPDAGGDIFGKFARALAVRRQIRDVNRKYVRVLETSIPQAASEQLTSRFRRESFPHIYEPTQADAYLDQVSALDGLSDAQRAGLAGVAANYRDQVATANHSLSQLLNEHEDGIEQSLKEGDRMMLAMVGSMTSYAPEGMGDRKPPFDSKELLMNEDRVARQDDVLKQKRGYIVAAIDQAWSVLTPQQQGQAPRPEVPQETQGQKQLRQLRKMMQQSMQYAQQIQGEVNEQQAQPPGR